MGTVLTIAMRAAAVMAVLLLAGCGGLYQGLTDLSKAVPAVQPIEAGAYLDKSGKSTQIELGKDGGYRVTNDSSEVLLARIFGPVGGLYVAQIVPDGDKEGVFGYAIIRVDASGIQLAEDASELLGALLFDRLGVSPPREGAAVSSLTDNPWLNWAVLQEFIVTYRSQLVFEPLYAPAS